jgi:FAD binding domain
MCARSKISAAALGRELGRLMPGHRISSGGGISRCVIVTPEKLGELLDVIRLAAEHGVPVLPMSQGHRSVVLEELHIRLDLRMLSRILEFNESSGLVTVQSGVDMEGLGAWLARKKMTLAVDHYSSDPIQLWEFLQQPWAGLYGPDTGHKLEQVQALDAVLPDGTVFSSSRAPRRSTGPDFSWMLLSGLGRFGLVTEVTLRVVPTPVRVARPQFLGTDLGSLVECIWDLVPKISPRDVTIVGLGGDQKTGPIYQVLWTIWGERREISRKKDKITKAMADVAKPLKEESSYWAGLDSPGAKSDWITEFSATRTGLDAMTACLSSAFDTDTIESFRIFGFVHDYATIKVIGREHEHDSVACRCLKSLDGKMTQGSSCSCPGDLELTRNLAQHLDPAGVFAAVPELWRRRIQ